MEGLDENYISVVTANTLFLSLYHSLLLPLFSPSLLSLSLSPLSRQLQQQQAELGGGGRDGLYEAGQVTLPQVRLALTKTHT